MPVPGVPAGRAGAWVLCASLALAACGHRPGADADPGASAVDSTPRRDILAIEKKRYSQHDEELIIRDFFQDRRGGFFVDVGCAWPKRDNNTCYLETELGWSGIGIDALPEYARGWKARRPRSRFFNFIVTDHSGSVETFFRSELKGISSVRPRETFSGKRVRYEEIRVPTITLSRLLDDNGVSKVDLLSMDIEGAEPRALAGFDIDRFRPELVCIEMFHAGAETLEAYFAAHGYERIERYREHDKANAYFSPRASVAGAAAR